ncbi:MAG: 4a-hydroxytetrahydrobiopterin dehydratase [Acidobacteria bacterium]|nr:4a-hydroxytetrahydrobiopterin dehydratase [Acidobacteriota bacterium]
MPTKLDPSQIQAALADLPDWHLEGAELVQSFTFTDFLQAIAFVNQVAALAEAAAHHPDIDIRYNHVRLALTTHDAGGLTENDTHLAKSITTTKQSNQH